MYVPGITNLPNRHRTGLIARGSQYIRRAATNLVGDADASLVGARRLNESSCLEIYGVAPAVQGYYLNHRSEQVCVGWGCVSEGGKEGAGGVDSDAVAGVRWTSIPVEFLTFATLLYTPSWHSHSNSHLHSPFATRPPRATHAITQSIEEGCHHGVNHWEGSLLSKGYHTRPTRSYSTPNTKSAPTPEHHPNPPSHLRRHPLQGENGTVYTIGDSVFINVTFDR